MSKSPTIDFDHHGPEYAEDSIGVLRAAREVSPVAWTEAHGGYWLVTGYEEMRAVALDVETFSSLYEPGDSPFKGQAIPGEMGDYRNRPESVDPPESFDYRRVYSGRLTPRLAEGNRDRYREMADWCIDRRIESGRIDLVLDLAATVPAMVAMELLGIPLDEWESFAEPVHEWVYTPPESPHRQRVVADYMKMHGRLAEAIQDRKKNPTGDLISHLTQATVRGGEPLTDDELVELVAIVVNGGVDTTTTLLSNVFLYLDWRPEFRTRLLEDPDFQVSAREEFLRFFSPVGGLARTVTKSTELAGSKMERGDRVMISWMGANHDPKEFDRPDEVILDRFPNRHCAFGIGIHRCLGSNIARHQFDVVLEQALRRLPDYEVDRDAAEPYPTQITPGWIKVPATFTPGRTVGAQL